MKNLKINSKKIKSLIGAGLILTGLTGCSYKTETKTESTREIYSVENSMTNEEGIKQVVIDNKLVSLENIKLYDTKTKEIVEKVDGILVDNKLMDIKNPVEIVFSDDIEKVLINNELVDADNFKLINTETKEVIEKIEQVIINNELVDVDYDNKDKETSKKNDSKDEDKDEEEEYEELTEEKFEEIVSERVKEYKDKGLAFDTEDVVMEVLMANMSRLCKDNPEFIQELLEDNTVDHAFERADSLQDSFNSYNKDYFRKTGKTDKFILASDLIFDKKEKKVARKIESEVNEILEANCDNEKLFSLLTNIYEEEYKEYNMEASTNYVLRFTFRPIRDLAEEKVFKLDEANDHMIKYFVPYAIDDFDYYINGWSTLGWQNTYALANEVVNENTDCKTLTK